MLQSISPLVLSSLISLVVALIGTWGSIWLQHRKSHDNEKAREGFEFREDFRDAVAVLRRRVSDLEIERDLMGERVEQLERALRSAGLPIPAPRTR